MKELFALVLSLPEAEQAAVLARECPGDEQLAAEVKELLGHARAATGFLTGRAENPRLPAELAPQAIQIEGFTLERVLGHGGMGIVYLARQHSPAREVAIKCLRFDTWSPQELERFRREAEILGRLTHPGLAQVHGTGMARTALGEQPWIAMEYVRGRPLLEHAAGLDLRSRIELLAELCRAVEHAHAKGIVHRDLKPGNVLVDDEGRVRVLDFGVARLLDEGGDTALRTRTGQMVGTLAYMSPEQARGATEAIDARSDVYALGVLGYELVSGQLPHVIDEKDLLGAVATICDEPPRTLRRYRPDAPRDLETIFLKALAKEPERRYASAGELEADLQRLLAERPIHARQPSVLYHVRKFVRRNRVLTGATLAVIAALATGLWLALASLRVTRSQIAFASEALDSFAANMVKLATQLGVGEANREDFTEVVALIDRQLAQDPTSRVLRAARADLLFELAWLDQSKQDFASMRAQLELAREAREALVAEDPADVACLTRLSLIYAKLGEAARDSGDPVEAFAWFERALANDERLVEEHPQDCELVEDLCWSLARVAMAAKDRGEVERANTLHQRRMELAERLVQQDGDNWKFILNLAHAQITALDIEEARGNLEPALQHLLENVRLYRRLCELEPSRRDFVFMLSGALRRARSFYFAHGSTAKALPLALEATSLAETIYRADPSRAEHANLTTGAFGEAFGTCIAAGDLEEAQRIPCRLRQLARVRGAGDTQAHAQRLLALAEQLEGELRQQPDLAASNPAR